MVFTTGSTSPRAGDENSCFGWALDVVQRIVTFALACIMMTAIGIGLIVAVAAGVAYGYNYSMAEYLTFTRSDTTVYMRRGQFYETPEADVGQGNFMFPRRSGIRASKDLLGMNKTIDYQDNDIRTDAKALPDMWKKIKDTRKYAEELTKYSPQKELELGELQARRVLPMAQPSPLYSPIAITPNPMVNLMMTTLLQSGTSQIVMRKFQPQPSTSLHEPTRKPHDDYFYQEPSDNDNTPRVDYVEDSVRKMVPEPDVKIRLEDAPPMKQYVPETRVWRTMPPTTTFQDYTEEAEEDGGVYKPV